MMTKVRKMASLVALATTTIALQTTLPAHAAPSVYPTGVTRYDPAKAWNGFVLFTGSDDITHLIDMNGHEVHSWNHTGFPPAILDPAINGGRIGDVLLDIESKEPPQGYHGGGNGLGNQSIGVVDWNDKVIWQWGSKAPGGSAQQHHDMRRLANGDTFVLTDEIHEVPGFALPKVIDDVIQQVGLNGDVKWTWKASEHINEFGFTPSELKVLYGTSNPDIFHINDLAVIGPNHWYDAGDKRFTPGNLVIDSRNANFIIIIDHETGKVVWRIGPNSPITSATPANKVPRPVDQTSGQHDSHLIPEGLPGAGNLLVFDNQGPAGYPPLDRASEGSRILEIDPVKNEVVWQYTAASSHQSPWGFYSSFISSARRLPNGNTLIDEGMTGRFFQVTPEGEIVWEYVSPYFSKQRSEIGLSGNSVYRAQPVPYNWVPANVPHTEQAVLAPDLANYRIAPN